MKCLQSVVLLLLFSHSAAALTCADLEGATVIGYDGKYLGFFGSRLADDSINNSLGIYGSEYSSSSVRSLYGSYGSATGTFSANDETTDKAPAVFQPGQFVAYLTANRSTEFGVALADIDAHCTFVSNAAATDFDKLPSALTGLDATDGNFRDKVLLTWDEADSASYYEVYSAETLDGDKTFITTTAALRAVVNGAVPGVTYYYFVYPSNPIGRGLEQWDAGYVNTGSATPTDFYAITSNDSSTTAVFGLAASKDMGETYSNNFTAGEAVTIIGATRPQEEDIGQAGYVYIVLRATTADSDIWVYRDMEGKFKPWDVHLGSLEPAYTTASLADSSLFLIYDGELTGALHRVYIGYRVADSFTLHYTPTAMRIEVSEEPGEDLGE